MKLTIVEKNLLSWTAMHIDFVMCKKMKERPFGDIEKFRIFKIFQKKRKIRIFSILIVPKM